MNDYYSYVIFTKIAVELENSYNQNIDSLQLTYTMLLVAKIIIDTKMQADLLRASILKTQ